MLIVALSFGFGKLGLFVVDGWMYWWVGGWLRKELLMEFIRKWWEIVSEQTSIWSSLYLSDFKCSFVKCKILLTNLDQNILTGEHLNSNSNLDKRAYKKVVGDEKKMCQS